MDRRRHQRQAENDAGVVDQVAGAEAIGAIEYQVVVPEQRAHVGGLQFQRMGPHPDLGIQAREPLAPGLGLGARDAAAVEQHLALQVGELHAIAVQQSQRAATRGRQIQRGRRAEPADADHQHAGRLQFLLSGRADLGERQMALVAGALARGQGHGIILRRARRSRARCRPRAPPPTVHAPRWC